jgi:cysteine desulfurase/selenocysteine lyase
MTKITISTKDFPALGQPVNGKRLAFLDSAASAQKPRAMLDATNEFLIHEYSNVHRGVHTLSQLATARYEGAREKVRRMLNAQHAEEIIFTSGCTAGINLVAQSFAASVLREGDEILLSELEHHSNIVPWQIVAQRFGARILAARIHDDGSIDRDDFRSKLSSRTRLVALTHISNALGTVLPIQELIAEAHLVGAKVLVDGAQSGPHVPVNVQALRADFYVLSCHKMYGPTGLGVVYGRCELLDTMPPYQGGGSMIREVTMERTSYAELPAKFEAGTPNIVGAIGFAATLDYLAGANEWGHSDWSHAMQALEVEETELRAYAWKRLQGIDGVRLLGPEKGVSIVSFGLEGIHPHDLGTILDQEGVAVRVGHHCCQPLMKRLGVPATTRVSIAAYTTRDDIDQLVAGVQRAKELFL